eukprot:CAMPEP_0204338270 /NCGR_PEP_ID=MMETSP0469-20131031/20939_1 /ASSEMBLY_ACC=CAM_ASM_000384 /TAXON_ID=2969 /ORGANISM="Oxyrrhis marina" /LENGTH=384 /DNA_ID=CAMNT_0051322419 /DNA_START=10 /DNA_END=1164 /DNA_ORIENTATION=+
MPAPCCAGHAAAAEEGGLVAAPTSGREAIGAFQMKFLGMVQNSVAIAAAGVADRTGLFRVMAEANGPLTIEEISVRGKYHPRYVREICGALVCFEFLQHDSSKNTFVLPEAQAKCLTDPTFALSVAGWLQMIPALYQGIEGVSKAMQTPGSTTGVPFSDFVKWGFAEGMARLNDPGIQAAYVRKWLPQFPGAVEKLTEGVHVADLGCGRGGLTITLASAFPKSTFVGVDLDQDSIAKATATLQHTSLTNVTFTCKDLGELPPGSADLVVNHDCIHDLKDPIGALRAVRRALRPGGAFLSMEPMVADSLEENTSPGAGLSYGISLLHCMTVSLAQGGMGLGAGSFGPKTYEGIAREAGFTEFQKVGSNMVNHFYELKGNTGAAAM